MTIVFTTAENRYKPNTSEFEKIVEHENQFNTRAGRYVYRGVRRRRSASVECKKQL